MGAERVPDDFSRQNLAVNRGTQITLLPPPIHPPDARPPPPGCLHGDSHGSSHSGAADSTEMDGGEPPGGWRLDVRGV
jgi:hypothetical protein